MVWIHGGGFSMGSSKEEWYGPQFLIAHDIVLVTFNYRIGIFGKTTKNKKVDLNLYCVKI